MEDFKGTKGRKQTMLIDVSRDEFYKTLESLEEYIVEERSCGGVREWICADGLVARAIQKYTTNHPIRYLLSEDVLNKWKEADND